MYGENFELTQLLPDLEFLLTIMGNVSYQCPRNTSNTMLEQGEDNRLAERRENSLPRGIF